MSKALVLSGGVTFVDDEDFERASQFRWAIDSNGYVTRRTKRDGRWTSIYLHRFLMDAPEGMEVDHINGDRLDNRRSAHLRLVTRAQNAQNIHKVDPRSRTGLKGVAYRPDYGRRPYQARIGVNGTRLALGCDATPEAAAEAVTRARRRLLAHAAEGVT